MILCILLRAKPSYGTLVSVETFPNWYILVSLNLTRRNHRGDSPLLDKTYSYDAGPCTECPGNNK